MFSLSNRSTKLMLALVSGGLCWGLSTAAPALACGRSACPRPNLSDITGPNLSDITGPNLSDITGPNLSDITGPNLSDNTGGRYSPIVRNYREKKAAFLDRLNQCADQCSEAEWSALETEKASLQRILANIREYRRW